MNTSIDFSEQAQYAERFINHTNRNVFLTGKAGTGKTTFLKHIIATTHKKTIVAAPTGIAALNAGGVTLHSQFQLPLAGFVPEYTDFIADSFVKFETKSTILRHMRMSDIKRKTIKEAELLIIDEVSMLRADILDAVDFILQYIRRNRLSFGGVQVLFIGDLLQLPPVVKNEEWSILKSYYDSPFFFDARVIKQSPPVYIELEKIYRQKDKLFTDVLNNLRYNQMDYDDVEVLNERYRPNFHPSPEEGYITLTTHNRNADEINQRELQNLLCSTFIYEAIIQDDFPESMFPVEQNLLLKEGAQVMFIKNDISGEGKFYNGKIGVVKELDDEKIIVKTDIGDVKVERHKWENIRYNVDEQIREIKEETLGTFSQYPLRLAWAITIHKSQGLTFQKAILDVKNVFASGQAYVAFSRLTGLEGLVLTSPFGKAGIANSNDVLRFEETKSRQGEPEQILQRETFDYLRTFSQAVFEFSPLVSEWQQHVASYNKDETHSEKQQHAEWADKIYEQVLAIYETAAKFNKQLYTLFLQPENNIEHVATRLEAAKNYFEPLLKALSSEVFLHKKRVASLKGTKAYVSEIETLDAGLLNRLKDIFKAVLMAQSLKQNETVGKEVWLNFFDLNWRKQLAEKAVEDFPQKKKRVKGETYQTTYRLYDEGKSADEIAAERGLSAGTIHSHFAKLIKEGLVDLQRAMPRDRIETLRTALQKNKDKTHGEILMMLNNKFTYGELKMVVAHLELHREEE